MKSPGNWPSSDPKEAARLRDIVDRYFPHEHLEIEVTLFDGRSGWMRDFNRTRYELEPDEHLEPATGSAHVVHYGAVRGFRTTPTRTPYTVHLRFDPEEPDTPIGCVLVSESATVAGVIYFDDEAEDL